MNFVQHISKPTYQLISAPHAPEIQFSHVALFKQGQYVKQSDEEVSWMGFARQEKPMLYVVEDVILMPQEVSGTSTDIDPEAWFELEKELGADRMQLIRFWGHSHVNMGVNASGTDEETMATLSVGADWFIRAICNKKGEMKCSIFIYKENISFHDCSWSSPPDQKHDKECELIGKELEDKVRKKTWVVKKFGSPTVYGIGYDKWNPDKQKYEKEGKEALQKHFSEESKKKVSASPSGVSLTDEEVDRLVEDWYNNEENLIPYV